MQIRTVRNGTRNHSTFVQVIKFIGLAIAICLGTTAIYDIIQAPYERDLAQGSLLIAPKGAGPIVDWVRESRPRERDGCSTAGGYDQTCHESIIAEGWK